MESMNTLNTKIINDAKKAGLFIRVGPCFVDINKGAKGNAEGIRIWADDSRLRNDCDQHLAMRLSAKTARDILGL